MIKLTKLNGSDIVVNAELIESVEATPDTVINLATGNRFLVRDGVQDVVDKVVEYRKKVYSEKRCVNPIEGFERK
ncbi:MAG TPA: flagellar FlbD family protein [Elusimicrobiales bacterium]|nr:flagellar FlbD family protein [Elusimicrobiales bacterium]